MPTPEDQFDPQIAEGGALTFSDAGLKKTFDYLRDFGFENELEVVMPGTNAKMNELQALVGLQVLGYMDRLVAHRRQIDAAYRRRLKDLPGIRLPSLPGPEVR